MKNFPSMSIKTMQDILDFLRYVQKERKNDVNDFFNLKNVYISGRKVGKIPTGASDVSGSDTVGDFNYSADYLYILVDDSGTAEWRRVALSSW